VKPKALIWDVDGTLAETEEVHRHAFNTAFKESGYEWEWSWEKYCELLQVTGGVERISHFLRSERPGEIAEDIFEDEVKRLHKEKTSLYVSMIKSGSSSLRPGVERLMLEAKNDGIILAIATTTTLINLEMLIDNSPDKVKMNWFDVIGAGNIIKHKKPAPDIYNWTLNELSLEPHNCVAMEDSVNGLKSASAAGIPTVITYSSYTKHQSFDGAMLIADSLGEPDVPANFSFPENGEESYIDMNLINKAYKNFIC